MASETGSMGRNFLEGSGTSDRIYGDSSITLSRSRTSGSDKIYGYDGADFLYGDAKTLSGAARGAAIRSGAAMTATTFTATHTA
jgi:serralysin